MKVRNQQAALRVEVPMTPMIDVVFQLLVFFIMSFKIVAPEGDFNIKMPFGGCAWDHPVDVIPTFKVALHATAEGDLAGIRLNETPVASLADLRGQLLRLVSSAGAQREDFACELHADSALHYDHMVSALTAISGQRTAAGNIERLIENVRFAPPTE